MSKTFIVRTPGHPLFGQRIQGNNGMRMTSIRRHRSVTDPNITPTVNHHNRDSKVSKIKDLNKRARNRGKNAVADHLRQTDNILRRTGITRTQYRNAQKRYALKHDGKRISYRHALNIAAGLEEAA
jgi:hypothetical protein